MTDGNAAAAAEAATTEDQPFDAAVRDKTGLPLFYGSPENPANTGG